MSETKPPMPTETAGTKVTRFNALRHGVLSRYMFCPGRMPMNTMRSSKNM